MNCPRCHDRGVLDGGGYCGCFTGRNAEGLNRIRARLSAIWQPRYVDFWLTARNQAMGSERPLDLVRQGRTEEVLAAVERLPGIPPRKDAASLSGPLTARETSVPEPLRTVPDSPDAVRRVLATKFRRSGEHRIARAIELGRTEDLSESERARLEAASK